MTCAFALCTSQLGTDGMVQTVWFRHESAMHAYKQHMHCKGPLSACALPFVEVCGTLAIDFDGTSEAVSFSLQELDMHNAWCTGVNNYIAAVVF